MTTATTSIGNSNGSATRVDHGNNKANGNDLYARAPLTAAVLKGVGNARSLIQDQFKSKADQFGGLQKAKDIVETVQSRVETVGGKVREESKDAVTRLETIKDKVSKFDFEALIGLPAEVQSDCLIALGIARESQIAELTASLDALRGEVKALRAGLKKPVVKATKTAKASTKKVIAKKATKTAKAPVKKATAKKATAKKASAKKATAKSAA